ncbi:glycine zipper 2TM domain-containing protein [Leeia aquatica]|uniref:Glycine zipper 2TM domain-containing protein n=1 Tax=Leeia aquatica TaxID=2725557 RepID=A0A847S844_9NEIS|nr:glycine zipper 2TM domain-containing protein [Leeia aquatica]NLR75177.1 glycine zipper 2TM domain-containing protein [Leeia aquatica]
MNLPAPRLLLALLLSSGLLFGCASSKSGNVYSAGSARTAQTVEFGVVQNVRQVIIEGSNSGVGAAGGAVIGGIAGSHVGKGSGQTVGAVVGGILGGLAGSAAERAATKRDGLEITVKLDSGRMIAIVQEADQAFRIGDKVQVLSGGGEARVTPR